jgi:hypothetical protein
VKYENSRIRVHRAWLSGAIALYLNERLYCNGTEHSSFPIVSIVGRTVLNELVHAETMRNTA